MAIELDSLTGTSALTATSTIPCTDIANGDTGSLHLLKDILATGFAHTSTGATGTIAGTAKILVDTGAGAQLFQVSQLPGTGGGGGTVMGASGSGHAAGLAPDPGSTAGTLRFLREDASWVEPSLQRLADVSVVDTGVTNGYVLTWNLTAGYWQAGPPTGGTTNLYSLGDVTVTEGSAIDGYFLRYVNSANKWEAYNLLPFVGSGAGHTSGLVPDPGPTPGTTRFLREDGAFATTPGAPTFENVGGGYGVYGASTGGTVTLRSFVAGSNISLTETADKITVAATPAPPPITAFFAGNPANGALYVYPVVQPFSLAPNFAGTKGWQNSIGSANGTLTVSYVRSGTMTEIGTIVFDHATHDGLTLSTSTTTELTAAFMTISSGNYLGTASDIAQNANNVTTTVDGVDVEQQVTGGAIPTVYTAVPGDVLIFSYGPYDADRANVAVTIPVIGG